MAARTSVALVNYNGLADTLRCLRSLEAAGGPDTVIVDNASAEDPSATLRRDFPWCEVIRNPVNGGWAGGNNVGIRYALARGADSVILLNNDTVVAPDFVAKLAAADSAYGIVGPVIRFMDPPHEVQTDGCIFNGADRPGFFQRRAVELVVRPMPTVTDVDIVNGCCMMVRADVFRRIGLIDERFFLIHEESDFCLRARRVGIRCGVLGAALVWHKGSSSFRRNGARWQRYYDARNLALLLSKHAAAHRRGRGVFRSYWEYLKYAYYRYALEREAGHGDAADAVVEGVHDALTRRFGPHRVGSRPAFHLLRGVFESWRTLRTRSKRSSDPARLPRPLAHATAVR
ncbi:MAG TPA: glycosyltransferase family 2 protein [Gemmataceae bacterium]|nr:glycosyltransferase family 2 protein [Gemmataceae bacterium]